MARLIIPNEDTSESFTVTTAQTVFPISFALFAKADLTVTVGGVALTQSDFTFSGTQLEGGGYQGGTVTLVTAVSNTTVVIERNVEIERASNYAPSNAVPVRSVDMALNRQTAISQDLSRRTGVAETEAAAALATAEELTAAAFVSALDISTRARVPLITVPSWVKGLRVAGHTTAGDGGGGLLVEVASDYPYAIQSADGAWWGWDTAQKIHAEMFGAKGDLAFTLTATGYERSGGTDDLAAFEAADAFCAELDLGPFYANGDYYINGKFTPSDGVGIISETGFNNYIWLHYSLYEMGINFIEAESGALKGMNLIGQYDYTGSKPANNGQLGSILLLGEFYLPEAHVPVRNLDIDVRVCRAANVSGQVSKASIMVNVLGWSERNTVRLGLHGHTNVTSLTLFQSHWGAHYDPASLSDPPPDDKSAATVLATYHPMGNRFTVTTDLDNADGHGFTYCWAASSVGGMRVSDVRSYAVPHPYMILAGDLTNAYAIAEQKDRVGRDNHAGFQYHTASAPGVNTAAVLITSRGTSKFEDYTGTSIDLIRQLETGWSFDGHWMDGTDQAGSVGIRLFGVLGDIDLGDCWIYGYPVAIENEQGVSNVRFNVRGSDGLIEQKYVRGGSMLGTATKRGDAANSGASGLDESGYNSDNAAVYLIGDSSTGTSTVTTADIVTDDTEIPITAFASVDVHVGQRIKVGDHTVFARECIDNGVPYLVTTPIPANVSSGATVTLYRDCYVEKIKGNYESSEFGLDIVDALVGEFDPTEVSFTGRYICRLQTKAGINRLVGRMPLANAQLTTASAYSFSVDSTSFINAVTMDIPAQSSRTTAHFQISRLGSSGPWGRVAFVGSRIENVSTLVTATVLNQAATFHGCFDYNGAPVASGPRHGSATYDPPSLADGDGATTTVTVTGAALGDYATASFSLDLQGITVTAWVSAANTVSVRFQNETGGVIDLASGTLRATAVRYS